MKVILATIFIGLIATTYAKFEPKCPEDGTGNELLPDPEDCEKFWYCKDRVPRPAYCPRPQYFDIKTLSCVDKDKATCAEIPAVPEVPQEPEQPEQPQEPQEPEQPEQPQEPEKPAEPEDPEEPAEPERPPVDCPKKMKPTDNVLLPNPKDCGSFYQCVYGYPHLLRCPAGLHYNSRRQLCDWPELAKCTVRPQKE